AHDGSFCAVDAQVAVSKTGTGPPAGSGTRKRSIAAFGFGGSATSAAAAASTSPEPDASEVPSAVCAALSMSAPFTWSGVHVGCAASTSAAAPETTGAANEVP